MTTLLTESPRFTLTPGTSFVRNVESDVGLLRSGDGRVLQLGADLGRLCELIAQHPAGLSTADLGSLLAAAGWQEQHVTAGLAALRSAGVVQQPDPNRARRQLIPMKHLELRRTPLMLRLTLLDPSALCARLARFGALLSGRRGLALGAIGLVIQVFAWLVAPAPILPAAAGHSLPVVLAVLATCLVHELAHGIALAHAGGVPRRMGFMLFYLVIPSFFCDVTDGFKLSRRAQVDVALAGIVAQAQLGALCSPLLWGPEPVGAMARLYLGLNLVMIVGNLIPFVALDGYFALRAMVGVPDLRAMAMRLWWGTLRSLATGSARPPIPANRGWLLPYGLVAAVLPVGLTAFSLSRFLALLPNGAAVPPGLVLTCVVTIWIVAPALHRRFVGLGHRG